jgi:putative transcription factor
LSCEICGEEIFGKPAKVIVEGAILEVCGKCAHLGKPYRGPQSVKRSQQPSRPRTAVVTTHEERRRPISLPRTYEEFDVVAGFGQKIRAAREHSGMTQADLAAKVKEKLSIIQKVELEKMVPNTNLCLALEHVLRMKLLTPRVEIPTGAVIAKTAEPTLGDVVKVKRKN